MFVRDALMPITLFTVKKSSRILVFEQRKRLSELDYLAVICDVVLSRWAVKLPIWNCEVDLSKLNCKVRLQG